MPSIAIIHHNRNLRSIFRIVLEHAGYEITTIDDPKWGRDFVLKNKPDLAIIGNTMPHTNNRPNMNGLELLQEIKTKSDVPVILCSVMYDDIRDDSVGIKADDYISTFCTDENLVLSVKKALGAKQRVQ